ncbi:prolyl oligopeptidase family serine peptidase, partial [Phenylobacterium sp.]|uniref:alpha/beta hydrolase family protein n=1 Tax=Phenylobacterium sp. TaxID=1871053 RepID=UPI0030F3A4C7
MPDIIEVTRITSVAISADGARWAFIAKQPSLDLGESRYGLYLGAGDGPARKVAEGPFIADLQARPGHQGWTVRGAFGDGVQVYELDATGRRTPRVVHHPLVQVGGDVSLAPDASGSAHATGVLAYGWSPDGQALWYVTLRPRSAPARQAWRDHGLTYVDGQTTPTDFYAEPAAEAVELWVRDVQTGQGRVVAEAPGDRATASLAFQGGGVAWDGPRRLVFRRPGLSASGAPTQSSWRYELGAPSATALPADAASNLLASVPTAQGRLALTRLEGDRYELSELTAQGTQVSRLGPVSYSGMGGGLGAWKSAHGQALYGVRLPDRFGLAAYPNPTPLSQVAESLHPCAFDAALERGVCSRESLTGAPELVEVRAATGDVRVLARPNARYDAITPLHSQPATWTNRFGTTSSGYITYPRGYETNRCYPAIVITHAADARNLFAADTFQWAFPLQVLAERGYVVLSVNETTQDLAASEAYGSASSNLSPARMQRAMGMDAVATMEAAVADVVGRGMVDPARVGIAGYSRGGIVTTLALSQSKVFRAGINADTAFFSAGGFFRGGMVREIYRGLFGGSPWDARYAA